MTKTHRLCVRVQALENLLEYEYNSLRQGKFYTILHRKIVMQNGQLAVQVQICITLCLHMNHGAK